MGSLMDGETPIPFNRPYEVGTETKLIGEAISNGHLSGHGPFARLCERRLLELTGAAAVLMTPSCSAALEMAVMLAGVEPGDEVIMPSYTFVSTANAVVLRGGTPVFVDIRPETMNIDERLIEEAITDRTKAIIVVHYGGVAARMDEIMSIASESGVRVIEDAAHCINTSLDGRELGSFGDLATFSFHETKNVQCGEGGALVINDPDLVERAEIVQDKGTNRSRFLRGQVDKYTWIDIGSSFLASELGSAFLFAQLETVEEITARRLGVWSAYRDAFSSLGTEAEIRQPMIPEGCRHNGHLYFLILPSEDSRDTFIEAMADRGIQTVFHYVPLHKSPAGERFARPSGTLNVTDDLSRRLVRLPVWAGLTEAEVRRITDATIDSVAGLRV
jgi:dTDP-4-amino-4,6-dideoxygalactose transaminase